MRLSLLVIALAVGSAPEKPITTTKGPLGDLLRKWQAEGTAAGNVGDWYDNRDGDHSPLNIAPWPQLQAVKYTAEDIQQRRHWAAQRVLRPAVTFGNSSTSAPPLQGGSNIRMYYTQPRGLEFLHQQYRQNNLYIYPEHRDHDRRGEGSYGDLYPTNTPFLLASQGSSGSDQPFMRAIPYTLAAFRPDVKKKLVEQGLLMPTIQMILRQTNKHITDPKDYLTGKAHPTVFEGSWVNDLKMVQMAHDITIDAIPPLAQLKVLEEKLAEAGKDFFELPGRSEQLVDTPAVIARIVRGPEQVRRLVVSAEDSFDVNQRPLKYHWSVLRGDEKRITIKPLNDAGSKVELRVPYHDRFLAGPVPIESTRVDIGCFVHNGAYWSAPAFVTFHYLDNEDRTYDEQGRLREIAYGAGEVELSVANWNGLFDLLKQADAGLPRDLLLKDWKPDELPALHQAGEAYRTASTKHGEAQAKSKLASEARQKISPRLKMADDQFHAALKAHEQSGDDESLAALYLAIEGYAKVDAERKAADVQVQQAQRDVNEAAKSLEAIVMPFRDRVRRVLDACKEDSTFFSKHQAAIDALAKDPARQARLALARKQYGADQEPSTRFERRQRQRFHAELLAGVLYPGIVTHAFRPNPVDPRLTTPKSWRDVYRLDGSGWTRHEAGKTTDYHADGHIILDKDDLGRASKCRPVHYEVADPKKSFFDATIKPVPGTEVLHYEYAGPEDRTGKVSKREPVP